MPAPKTASTSLPSPEEFTARVKDFNEDLLASSKKAGETYVATVERSLKSFADLTEEVGKALPFDWTTPVATAQASFVRDVADAYAKAGRELVSA
jgi:hypothetical protein